MREEQRWLREEQRWLREEFRWNSERESLLRDIAALKLRIEELEKERPQFMVSDAAAGLETLLRAMKDRVAGTEGGVRVPPAALAEQADVKEMIFEEVTVSERTYATEERPEGDEKGETRRMLRKGVEGDDVRAMQEALHGLGFYSGEEDMEFETFSSGTERAVKTWQASLGVAQNGIMSPELLQKLFDGPQKTSPPEGTKVERKVIREEYEVREMEVSRPRVFLLGENRWEEPGRVASKNGPVGEKAVSRCLTCRGEGRLMCTECDGTGEPNIEPQFMEWVDEGTKCPYCEGNGFVICDICGG